MSGLATFSNSEATLSPSVPNHIARRVGFDVQQRINALRIGQKMQDLPEELWHKSFRFYVKEDPTRKGGPNLRMIRLDPAKPSLTVTGYIFNKFVHPFEDRFVTVREAARLQGFPDELAFQGTLTSTQLQVGNAVPVPLARAVFQAILHHASTQGFSERPLKAMSLFSGAGGMDIGADQATLGDLHIDTRVAVEYWSDACHTLQNYHQRRASVVLTDVSKVASPQEYWRYYSKESHSPDIVFGGPPCQAFSQAGKQKGIEDERGGMVFHFLRFVEHLTPIFFVMENVANLKGTGGGQLYRQIVQQMHDLGYEVTVCELLAADFGAPQLRRRLFFIGSRMGQVAPPSPTHSNHLHLFDADPYIAVRAAFAGLPPATFSTSREKERGVLVSK
jgi:DNA (cytosine-5)-methyltransferase 1